MLGVKTVDLWVGIVIQPMCGGIYIVRGSKMEVCFKINGASKGFTYVHFIRHHLGLVYDNFGLILFQEDKSDILFGRFSDYDRHLHPNDTRLYRKGSGGRQICSNNTVSASGNVHSVQTVSCQVRRHFAEWARAQPASLGIDVLVGNGKVRFHASCAWFTWL